MKNKSTSILLIVAFTVGIVFAGVGAILVKKSFPLVTKIKKKLEARVKENMPKADKPFTISDFEKNDEILLWDTINASIALAEEHAVSGKYSAKLAYQPSGGSSAVKLEKCFENNAIPKNWSPYEVLTLAIYNPSTVKERMILQIKDSAGNKIKNDISLRPNQNNVVNIDIREMWESIKVDRIDQLNLFLWGNKSEKTFYLDDVRLLSAAAAEKAHINILQGEFLPTPGEAIYATGDYFAFDSLKWTKQGMETGTIFVQAPLIINNPLSENINNFYFTGGIPFPKGELNSLNNVHLCDAAGDDVSFQAKVLSKWQDDSIKWALFDVRTSVAAKEKKELALRYSTALQAKDYKSVLLINEDSGKITVDTGKIKFSVNKSGFTLLGSVWVGGKVISAGGDMVLVHDGVEYRSSLDKNSSVSVEETGRLKTRLKADGWFVSKAGRKFCKFITRITAFEGADYLNIQHTFIYTGYPENKYHYLYDGKRLPKNETIDAIYIETPVNLGTWQTVTYGADGAVAETRPSGNMELYQGAPDSSQNRFDGWVDVSSDTCGVSISVKNFWQQFPKKYYLDTANARIKTYLWPDEAGKLDFKTTEAAFGSDSVARGSAFGVAKTHELIFDFHTGTFGESAAKNAIDAFNSDTLITASPEWVSDTAVLGRVAAYDKRFNAAEDFLSRLFDWSARQIVNFRWYGMVDFGDTLSWYRQKDPDVTYDDFGWHPVGRWGWFNCEAVGTHSGALIQFLRTGDYKYYYFGANQARHIMDIDTCHYNTVANDKRLKGVIFDDYSRVGSMHRHNGNHWGDRNEEASHTNVFGILLYYHMTGDPRALDVIGEIGQFFLSERITYFRHPDIAPQRTLANILWGDVQLYEFTGDEKYKKAADKWAQVFFEGQKSDGAWAENYNPVKKRWEGGPHMMYIQQYTVPAMIAYHQLTGNKAIAKCITNVTDFIIDNATYNSYCDALAYSYWLTGDGMYSSKIAERVGFIAKHQNRSADPIWDGMIYQKAYYARPDEFLYNVCYGFEVLQEALDGRK